MMFRCCLIAWLTSLPASVWAAEAASGVHPSSEQELRRAILASRESNVELPAGNTVLHRPIEIHRPVELHGSPKGSSLEIAADFKGEAAITARGVQSLVLAGFSVMGNREMNYGDKYLPPSDVCFRDYYEGNGILIVRSKRVVIRDITFERIRSFAVLVSSSSDVSISFVAVKHSGSFDGKGRNNTTGGILFEEGTKNFSVRRSRFYSISGNGIWTHANYGSERNADGIIEDNILTWIGRDAIQVGHAVRVRVERNQGSLIGYPVRIIDVEGYGTPVALDTAGNVDQSFYKKNVFTDVNGECVNLDGFHDGEVTDNSCINRHQINDYPNSHYGIVMANNDPDMKSTDISISGNHIEGFAYGGVFVIGTAHRIVGNQFLNINRAHCTGDMTRTGCNYNPSEPGMLRSGIYLGLGGGHPAPATGNLIRDNTITGFGMDKWCVGSAPGVDLRRTTLQNNHCSINP